MTVTRELVHDQLLAYPNREITLAQLVDWADVHEFGLSWDDCYDFLAQMGYRMEVEATPLATGAKRYDSSLHR